MKALRNLLLATPIFFLAALQAAQAAPPTQYEAGSLKSLRSESAKPYSQNVGTSGAGRGYGPGTGVLGITSITVSNSMGSGPPGSAVIFSAWVVGPTCDSPVLDVVNFRQRVYVQPLSTVQLTFPSPLVFPPVNGLTCYGVIIEQGGLELLFNGFVN